MQKWHKKLALAFIDIARVNAYVTKCMRDDQDKPQRNQHRQFMIELASELISGKWKDCVEDEGMLFADEQHMTSSPRPQAISPKAASPFSAASCDFMLSKIKYPKSTRGKRGCKVCAFEGRPWTMKTIYCTQHNVVDDANRTERSQSLASFSEYRSPREIASTAPSTDFVGYNIQL
ncbi:hypothetical protein ATCC90586_011312 [Pythium insidiosum]|nr:hypothetical protein ATCC90586_011312 [Pythium insidiosum]